MLFKNPLRFKIKKPTRIGGLKGIPWGQGRYFWHERLRPEMAEVGALLQQGWRKAFLYERSRVLETIWT